MAPWGLCLRLRAWAVSLPKWGGCQNRACPRPSWGRHWWACGRSGRGKRRSWRPRPRSSWWATRGVGARPRCPWWGNCCFLAGRGPTTPVTDLERRLRRAGRCGRAYDGVSSREFCRRVPALAWCFRPRQPESGSQTAYIEGSTGGIWAGIHMYRAPVESLPKRKRQREGPYLTVAGLLLPCPLTPRRRTRRAEISPPPKGR